MEPAPRTWGWGTRARTGPAPGQHSYVAREHRVSKVQGLSVCPVGSLACWGNPQPTSRCRPLAGGPTLGLTVLPLAQQPGPQESAALGATCCHGPLSPWGFPAPPGLLRKPWEGFLRMFSSCCPAQDLAGAPVSGRGSRSSSEAGKPGMLAGRPRASVVPAGCGRWDCHFVVNVRWASCHPAPWCPVCKVAPPRPNSFFIGWPGFNGGRFRWHVEPCLRQRDGSQMVVTVVKEINMLRENGIYCLPGIFTGFVPFSLPSMIPAQSREGDWSRPPPGQLSGQCPGGG